MRGNQYHLLGFIPATRAWEMPPALEKMAQQLVESGKLRINADAERNFVRLGTSDTDRTFTARELTAPHLRAATWDKLARHVPPARGTEGVNELHQRLLGELKKARGISIEKEAKVARVLVQSTHPAVMELLLRCGTEIYVSYAHNVADLMPVHAWQSDSALASGLQATEPESTAVYVSCGGDPFFEGEHKTYTTDGWSALARMVVIAGQELGHFADLKRDARGITGRYSLDPNSSRLRAHPTVRDGRERDMQRVSQLAAKYQSFRLPWLRRMEKAVDFYHQRLRFTPPWMMYQLLRGVAFALFALHCTRAGIYRPLHSYPSYRHGEALELWLEDMAFNLAPDADVYRHPDPLVEEAVACIEALARVPQQVHKWGHDAVQASWPNLYGYYFGTVIPAAEGLVGSHKNINNINGLHRFAVMLKRLVSPRPGYYPEKPKKSQKTA